jgi:hypothetical protein
MVASGLEKWAEANPADPRRHALRLRGSETTERGGTSEARRGRQRGAGRLGGRAAGWRTGDAEREGTDRGAAATAEGARVGGGGRRASPVLIGRSGEQRAASSEQ